MGDIIIDGTRIVCFPSTEFEYAIWEQVNDDGCYSPDTNMMYILTPQYLISTISHEFLHMVMKNEHGDSVNEQFDNICRNGIDNSGINL